jgi:hypothetical protein
MQQPEQHVVSMQMALMSWSCLAAVAAVKLATAPCTASPIQVHQSVGDCSAQPGWGCNVEYGTAQDDPRTCPVWAWKQQARMDSVPPSTPMTTGTEVDDDDDDDDTDDASLTLTATAAKERHATPNRRERIMDIIDRCVVLPIGVLAIVFLLWLKGLECRNLERRLRKLLIRVRISVTLLWRM